MPPSVLSFFRTNPWGHKSSDSASSLSLLVRVPVPLIEPDTSYGAWVYSQYALLFVCTGFSFKEATPGLSAADAHDWGGHTGGRRVCCGRPTLSDSTEELYGGDGVLGCMSSPDGVFNKKLCFCFFCRGFRPQGISLSCPRPLSSTSMREHLAAVSVGAYNRFITDCPIVRCMRMVESYYDFAGASPGLNERENVGCILLCATVVYIAYGWSICKRH